MKLTKNKLKKLIKEQLEEAMLNPTFWLNREKRMSLLLRILNDPKVDPRLKDMLNSESEADINQAEQMVASLYPEYAEEIDLYNSRQDSFEYSQEFDRFYDDAKGADALKETLKKITKEELEAVATETFNEGIGDNFYGMYGNKTQSPKPINSIKPIDTSLTEPELPPEIEQRHHDKLKSMLQSDDEYQINSALELVNALAPNSSFEQEYREYLINTKLEKMMDNYDQAVGPDERVELRKQIYDLVNKRAGELYPDDRDAAYDYAYDKINKAGIMQEAKLNPTFDATLSGKLSFSRRVMRDPKVHQKIKDLMSTGDPADTAQAEQLIMALYPEYAEELESHRSPQSSLDYKHDFIHFYHDAKKRAKEEPPGLSESLMFEGDDSILEHFHGATLEEGDLVCEACLFEQLQEASCGCPNLMGEAEYQGRKVTLNKPMRGDVKKFKVYVKDPKTGNVKKVNFGDPNMKIKKSNPKRRKSFRARHNCDNPGPKTKARYWSCKKW